MTEWVISTSDRVYRAAGALTYGPGKDYEIRDTNGELKLIVASKQVISVKRVEAQAEAAG